MLLPNSENAVVEFAKLRDYSLNMAHDRGGHKAIVFRSALGITVNDVEWLRSQILESVKTTEGWESTASTFGRKFIVDLTLTRNDKSAKVRTSWIIEHGTDFPRLTSCYVI